jgi:hypothetical protein
MFLPDERQQMHLTKTEMISRRRLSPMVNMVVGAGWADSGGGGSWGPMAARARKIIHNQWIDPMPNLFLSTVFFLDNLIHELAGRTSVQGVQPAANNRPRKKYKNP